MGATESILSSQYKIAPDKHNLGYFTLYSAISNAGENVSLFVHEADQFKASNAEKRHKILRHPGLVKYKTSLVNPKLVCIVTEAVIPLSTIVNSLSDDEILIGLSSVFRTIAFLHSINLIHGDIRLASIFVKDGTWLLGNLELVIESKDVNATYLDYAKSILPADFCYPNQVTDPFLIDSYCAGRFITEELGPIIFQRPDGRWDQVKTLAHRMMDKLSITQALSENIFTGSVLIRVVEDFLKEYRIMPPALKIQNFLSLADNCMQLGPNTVESIIIPLVLNPDLFIEIGANSFYGQLFTLESKIVSRQVYFEKIIPFIKAQFSSNFYEVRFQLLQLFDGYIFNLIEYDPDILENLVMKELVKGIEDTEQGILYPSICALNTIIPAYCEYVTKKRLESVIAPSSSRRNAPFTPNFLPSAILDNLIINHVMKMCIAEEYESCYFWPVIDSLIYLWRKCCNLVGKSKKKEHAEALNISKLLLRSFHLILRVLPADMKIELFTNHMINRLNSLNDSSLISWIPKIIELSIPFLQDENRLVRKSLADYLIKIISLQAAAMDRVPTIVKRRESGNVRSRLKQNYEEHHQGHSNFSRRLGIRSPQLDARFEPIRRNETRDFTDAFSKVDKSLEKINEAIVQNKDDQSNETPNKQDNHEKLEIKVENKNVEQNGHVMKDLKIESFVRKSPTSKWDDEFFDPGSAKISTDMDAFELDSMIAALSQTALDDDENQELHGNIESVRHIDRQNLVATRLAKEAAFGPSSNTNPFLEKAKTERNPVKVISLVEDTSIEIAAETGTNDTKQRISWTDEDFDRDLELRDVKL